MAEPVFQPYQPLFQPVKSKFLLLIYRKGASIVLQGSTTVADGETSDAAPGNGLVRCRLRQLPTGGSVIRCGSYNSCFHPETLCESGSVCFLEY